MACDLCGAVGTPLEPLRECYQTPDVKGVCPGCAQQLNDSVWKIRAVLDGVVTTLLKRYITERKKHETTTR